MDGAFDYLKFLATLFVMVDPIGAVPIFLGLTPHYSAERRAAAARKAVLTVAAVLVGCALAGEAVLGFFGIGIASFRVGGGIIFLIVALDMIQAQPRRSKQTPEEAAEAAEFDHIAVVPLGVPLLAGPGAISTMIIYSNLAETPVQLAGVMGLSLVVVAALYVSLRLASPISRLLGQTGINVFVRLMGLLLIAIAVDFITDGLRELLPGLGAP